MKKNVMTFIEKTFGDDEVFNLGCASGWIFIGTKAEWRQYVDVISDDYKAWYEDRENAAKKDCSVFKLTKCARIDTSKVKGGHRETDEEWKARIHKLADELHATIDMKFNNLAKAEERNKNFVRFDKRNVSDYYISDIEHIPCVILEGEDIGIFWLRSEFNKVYRNGKSIRKLAFRNPEDCLYSDVYDTEDEED